ncbi:MAG: GntR family transcriptional regulator [Thermodesulfobacteriota bacterium]
MKNKSLKAANKGRKGGDPSPLYYNIQRELQKRIESGEWAPGDSISAERKLAGEFGVSLGTMRKAILNLVAEGFLYRVQGRGTMVAGTTMVRENIRYYRFMKEFGGWEPVLKIEHLETAVIPGQERVNRLLKIRLEEELLLLRRRFWSQKKPHLYSVSFLPHKLFKGLEETSRNRLEKVPLYLIIEDMFGWPTLSNQELLGVELADEQVAEVLKIPEASPVLAIEMLAHTHRKKPYEYRIAYCLTDRGKIHRAY